MSTIHISVMREEALNGLLVEPGKKYIDATVGAGGHAVEIVKRGGIVLGIDTDPTAVEIAKTKGIRAVQGNFRDIEKIATREGFEKVSGVLFDLGVSSMQLDTPDRGFSYRFTDAPLDLRMNQTQGESSAQLVNRASKETLYDIFSTYGEEQLAGRIADAIYSARSIKKIETVGDMVSILERLVPDQHTRFSVLSRVFQALRIAVNEEMDALREGLIGAEHILEPGGRLVVISFHSLEDRIVKLGMRKSAWQVITKHPELPTLSEVESNRRSRSAKLRIALKKPI